MRSELKQSSQTPHRRRHVHPILISFAGIIVLLSVFSLGVASGRGNVSLLHSLKGNNTNPNLPAGLNYSSLNQVYNIIKDDYDGNLDASKLLDGAKSGLAQATGDPYTQYFNANDAKTFNEELSGSFTGIGAELGSDEDSNILIVSPLAGYPAATAGLKPKDIIVKIDGQSTQGLSIDKAVQKIRGEAGTSVTLSILRGQDQFDTKITRSKITVPSVEHHVDGNIGYIKISQFGPDTTKLSQEAATDLKRQGAKAIVLDLRGNPGGYLDSAVQVSSLWLDKGKKVVDERKGTAVISTQYATGDNTLKGLPTVVLIDAGSASASEITAGALRDNNVATLVGATSFGKGSVQEVENLSGGAELKVTIAHWYTPNGKNINKQGIKPDVAVAISDDDAKAGKDLQKDKAYDILLQKLQ